MRLPSNNKINSFVGSIYISSQSVIKFHACDTSQIYLLLFGKRVTVISAITFIKHVGAVIVLIYKPIKENINGIMLGAVK